MKFTISCLLPNKCLTPTFDFGLVILEKKMLTDDYGRLPIVILHPNDLGDLQMTSQRFSQHGVKS